MTKKIEIEKVICKKCNNDTFCVEIEGIYVRLRCSKCNEEPITDWSIVLE